MELEECLNRQPALWACLGDLGGSAKHAWVHLIAGTDDLMVKAIQNTLAAMQKDLETGVQDPAARLLIDRILVTWLQVTYADARMAEAGDCSNTALEYLTRRQANAQKQYLAVLNQWRLWQRIARQPAHGNVPPVPTPGGSPVAGETEAGPDAFHDSILPFQAVPQSLAPAAKTG